MALRIFLFSFWWLIFTSAFSQVKAKAKAKGTSVNSKPIAPPPLRIKSKSAYEFKFSLGERKRDSLLLYSKKYNEKGELMEDSSPAEKIIYEYDGKGKLALETSFDAGHSVRYKDVYLYDDKGNMIEKTEYGNNEKISFKIQSKYNDKRQETEKTVFDSIQKIQGRQLFAYNERGNKTEETQYDSAFAPVSKKIFTYDGKNNLIILILMKRDTMTAKYIYEYNEAGLKTKTLCYQSDGSINYKTIYEYDANKNLLRENTYQSAGISNTSWQYDENGNAISEIKKDGKGNIISKSTSRYNKKNIIEIIEYDYFDEPMGMIKYHYEFFPGK